MSQLEVHGFKTRGPMKRTLAPWCNSMHDAKKLQKFNQFVLFLFVTFS